MGYHGIALHLDGFAMRYFFIFRRFSHNGSYMLPNMLLALIIAGVLYVPLKKYFAGDDLRR